MFCCKDIKNLTHQKLYSLQLLGKCAWFGQTNYSITRDVIATAEVFYLLKK